VEWKKQSIELMKVLSDPRRERILHLAADEPVTVKYMAEQMNEDPLRLYYHVKKLLQVELLEVADTRQQGNLVEKYYKAVNFRDTIYQGNVEEQAEHPELALANLHRKLDPAVTLFQKGLEKVREEKAAGKTVTHMPYQITINTGSERLTSREWRKSIEKMLKAMAAHPVDDEPWPQVPEDGREDEVGTYEYILISYRIEDAERVGAVKDLHSDEDD
jgi:DNA-binding transcriptional ArsR family regulator